MKENKERNCLQHSYKLILFKNRVWVININPLIFIWRQFNIWGDRYRKRSTGIWSRRLRLGLNFTQKFLNDLCKCVQQILLFHILWFFFDSKPLVFYKSTQQPKRQNTTKPATFKTTQFQKYLDFWNFHFLESG